MKIYKAGDQFEDEVEQLLIENNIVYEREGTKVSRGHTSGKGDCDFKLKNAKVVMECKEIGLLNNLTLPGINRKTGKPYVSTRIHTHQLRFLRERTSKGVLGYLIIKETSTNGYYALTMRNLDSLLIENPKLRTLKNIDKHKIILEDFIRKLK